jgi:hypothetical protein
MGDDSERTNDTFIESGLSDEPIDMTRAEMTSLADWKAITGDDLTCL